MGSTLDLLNTFLLYLEGRYPLIEKWIVMIYLWFFLKGLIAPEKNFFIGRSLNFMATEQNSIKFISKRGGYKLQ